MEFIYGSLFFPCFSLLDAGLVCTNYDEIWWGAAQKDDFLRYDDDDVLFRLRMCSAEGALIESGKTKTSNHFPLTEHNHLCLRFTVLSDATKTYF